MHTITPFLWFDDNAEEAAHFYTSVFKNSKVTRRTRYGDEGAEVSGRPKGSVMTVAFQLNGQDFIALNGGPQFTFTEAVSFAANCETQEEVDELWERLSEGGTKGRCGWLKDKVGLSWQVVPDGLGELLAEKDEKKSARVMEVLLKMGKLDIHALRRAHRQA